MLIFFNKKEWYVYCATELRSFISSYFFSTIFKHDGTVKVQYDLELFNAKH